MIEGDPSSWAALVHRYSGLVYRIALGSGLSVEDAEEVAQDVWLALFRNAEVIRDPEALPAWLTTTARRMATRARQRAHAAEAQPVPPDLSADGSPVDELVAGALELDRIHRAMQSLPLRCRALLTALFRDKKPDYRDIATRLGVPRGSIGPTRARCLARLHRLIEAEAEVKSTEP